MKRQSYAPERAFFGVVALLFGAGAALTIVWGSLILQPFCGYPLLSGHPSFKITR